MSKLNTKRPRSAATLKRAVQRGIVLLNNEFPGWRALLKVRKAAHEFDFTDPCKCVLGSIGAQCRRGVPYQPNTERDYITGQRALGFDPIISYISTKDHGFDWKHWGEKEALAALWDKAIATGKV